MALMATLFAFLAQPVCKVFPMCSASSLPLLSAHPSPSIPPPLCPSFVTNSNPFILCLLNLLSVVHSILSFSFVTAHLCHISGTGVACAASAGKNLPQTPVSATTTATATTSTSAAAAAAFLTLKLAMVHLAGKERQHQQLDSHTHTKAVSVVVVVVVVHANGAHLPCGEIIAAATSASSKQAPATLSPFDMSQMAFRTPTLNVTLSACKIIAVAAAVAGAAATTTAGTMTRTRKCSNE